MDKQETITESNKTKAEMALVQEKPEIAKAFQEELQKILDDKESTQTKIFDFPPARAYIPDRITLKNIYPIIDGKVYAVISTNPITKQTKYDAIEPTLTEVELKALKLVRDYFTSTIDTTLTELGGRDKAIESLKKMASRELSPSRSG